MCSGSSESSSNNSGNSESSRDTQLGILLERGEKEAMSVAQDYANTRLGFESTIIGNQRAGNEFMNNPKPYSSATDAQEISRDFNNKADLTEKSEDKAYYLASSRIYDSISRPTITAVLNNDLPKEK